MKEKYKIHDPTIKEEVVRLSYESSSINQHEKELNLHPGSITKWQKDCEKNGSGSFLGKGHRKFTPQQETIYLLEKKIKQLDLKFEILKKGRLYISKGKLTIFDFINTNEKTYSIRQMCKVFGMKDETYYKWRNNFISETKKRKMIVQQEITAIFFEAKQRYGCARIAVELQNRGYQISRASVSTYMRELGLSGRSRKKIASSNRSLKMLHRGDKKKGI
jgi:transposase-like protein